jgi:hypothetical protein
MHHLIQRQAGLFYTAAAVSLAACSARASTSTTGLYDNPVVLPNQVDTSAFFFGGNSATNIMNVGAFTTSVLNAFNANQGGVFTFDNVQLNTNVTSISLSYGTGQSKSLTLGQGSPGNLNAVVTTFSEAISGDQVGVKNISAINTDFTFVFSSFANNFGAPDAGVTQFGFTFLSQGVSSPVNYGLLQATATFSGGSTVTAAGTVNSLRTLGDTFFGFIAPAGQTITQVTLPVGVTGDAFIEDIGFVTQAAVPEPAAAGLFALGLAGWLVSRRKQTA